MFYTSFLFKSTIFNIYSHELNHIGATKVPVIDLNYICTFIKISMFSVETSANKDRKKNSFTKAEII